MNDLRASIERAWVIDCSRCANSAQEWANTIEGAAVEFLRAGWTREGHRTFCPQCNSDIRPTSGPSGGG